MPASTSVIAGLGAFTLAWFVTGLLAPEESMKPLSRTPPDAERVHRPNRRIPAVSGAGRQEWQPPPPLGREIQLPPVSDLERQIMDASVSRQFALMTIRSALGMAVSRTSFKALKVCPGTDDLDPTHVRIESSVHVDANVAEIRGISGIQVDKGAPLSGPLAECLADKMRGFLPVAVDRKQIPAGVVFVGNTIFPVTLKNAAACDPRGSGTCRP
jgi:hypothetical protein